MEFRSKHLKIENQYVKTSMNINALLPVLKGYALFKHFFFICISWTENCGTKVALAK